MKPQTMDMGIWPWDIVFAHPNCCIFLNASLLMAGERRDVREPPAANGTKLDITGCTRGMEGMTTGLAGLTLTGEIFEAPEESSRNK